MLIPCLKAPDNIYHTYDIYFSFGWILNIPSKVFLSIDFISLISCHILWPLHLVILSSLCSFTLLVHFLRNISFTKPGLYLFHSIFHTVLQKINNHYSFRCKPSIEEKNKIQIFATTKYPQNQIVVWQLNVILKMNILGNFYGK